MHIHNLDHWKPNHDFHIDYETGERRSYFVLILTAVTMVVEIIENDHDNRVVDLHGWFINPKHTLLILSIVTHYPQSPEYYKNLLRPHVQFSHVTVEVHACESEPCIPFETSKT